jgi:hypothetical protein
MPRGNFRVGRSESELNRYFASTVLDNWQLLKIQEQIRQQNV